MAKETSQDERTPILVVYQDEDGQYEMVTTLGVDDNGTELSEPKANSLLRNLLKELEFSLLMHAHEGREDMWETEKREL
jgi:hypothetical protein